ncbi:MAG: hypothetical protein KBD26_00040 [Candidatus Pacebacteria bacterium]|nr:hypothetical protein [Candidatus Paceibacterota bacterium]MBP9772209.1 hypothetical protein [Candidatus Paceibacterota bacterium]QQR76940.1 MAG: hypothetical protein IPJ63_01630 [Candidatus Nomurabacteria bacterium]
MRVKNFWDYKSYFSSLLFWSTVRRNIYRILWRVILFFILSFFGAWILVALYGFLFERGEYDLSVETFSLLSPDASNYTSGDPETDMIVNYYAGKQDISREWKIMQFYQDTLFRLELSIYGTGKVRDSIKNVIKKIESMSYEEFDIDLIKRGIDIEERFHFAPDSLNSTATYQTIWKIYLSLGAPKLKYCPNSKSFPMQYADAFYDPINNRIFLSKLLERNGDSLKVNRYYCYTWNPDLFLEELGHAKQFKDKPASSLSKYLSGMANSRFVSFWSFVSFEKNKDWSSAYSLEYIRRGSFEREAHLELGGLYKQMFYSVVFSTPYEDIFY